MEILATVEDKGTYMLVMIVLSGFSLMLLSLAIYMVVDSIKNHFGFNEFFALIACLILSGFTGLGAFGQYKDGVHVEYKATITDFNEVYNNGYVITGQEGKLYILEKKD